MTGILILTRHAKSNWDDPLLDDFDRPLNNRGEKSAKLLAAWFRARGLAPDSVLCSAARRTRETLAGLDLNVEDPVFTNALYHANSDQMHRVLARSTGKTTLIIGHNPGIADFAERLVQSPPSHSRFYDYPTAATLVVEFDIDAWDELRPHTGKVIDFVTPHDLKAK